MNMITKFIQDCMEIYQQLENDIGYSIIEDVKNMNNGYIITGYTLSYGNKNL